ncbi:MAG TPA: hypothetical protein VMM36_15220, partial [Opitutaceae bacterium]|nr:hypothetical protein [Opitutaceae bacterium]
PEPLAESFRSDFRNDAWVREGIRTAVATLAPRMAADSSWNFQLVEDGDRFHAVTNLDFTRVNAEYHTIVPPEHSAVTPATLLAALVHARELANLGAINETELGVTGMDAALIQRLIGRALRDSRYSSGLVSFQDFVFDEGRAIRNAVNSGESSFQDLLPVLERAKKFRAWLDGIAPDRNLVKEYYRAVTKETWIDRLPARVLRWALFTATGVGVDAAIGLPGVATTAGAALGLGDTFLVDRIARGWRPNQFVHGALGKFVERDSTVHTKLASRRSARSE